MKTIWFAGEAYGGAHGGVKGDQDGPLPYRRPAEGGPAPDAEEEEDATALPPGWAAAWRSAAQRYFYIYL
eukprot:10420335-Alexandrium_andersonii.AAC.1